MTQNTHLPLTKPFLCLAQISEKVQSPFED
jgi:hypothetical protein